MEQVTITIDKAQDTDLTITLSNNQEVVIPKGETKVVANVETSRIDDAYKQGTTNETYFNKKHIKSRNSY